ncbi:MAG: helicase [Clostridia bacterium]|nr:helicase [Clostridia bacterium]
MFLKMCESATNKGNKVLVLVHRKELAEQHKQLLKDNGLDTENIRVALFWSEANRLGKYDNPDLIIADEAHWIPQTLRKVLDYYDCRVIALTATPCRLSGDPMGAVYEDMVVGIGVKELIERKRLAPYDYYSVPVVDVSGLSVNRGDYVIGEAEELLSKPAIYGDVIESYEKYAENKKTIVYCTSIKHSQSVAEAFKNAGFKAAHMDSNTPKAERIKIMDDFRNGDIQIICNVMLIVEGISVSDCECCILLRPTLSTTIFIQSAMRCMRYKEGKRAVIIDMVANYLKLGMPDEDREWSLDKPIKHRKDINPEGDFYIRTCKKCFKVFKTAPVCPYCGETYPLHPREIKAHENIELARITAEQAEEAEQKRKQARMEQGRAQTFEELLAIGRAKGYKNPAYWAQQVMRGRKRQ